MTWRRDDPQCNEAAKIKYDIVPYTRGRGLDIGCGGYKAYPHFIGVDNGHHWGTDGVDVVTEADDLSVFSDESMDFVFSSHLLEHMRDPSKALAEWWRTIKVGGYLVLYLPHKALYPNVGQPGANPDHKSDFLPEDIHELMPTGFDLLVQEVRDTDHGPGYNGNEYSFYQVYKKTRKRTNYLSFLGSEDLRKTCCVVRYGGFGDLLQAASVIPELVKQGYRVTVMTTPKGQVAIKHDPYITDFILQDTDQVSNEELPRYWACWARKFDKFVNLSMSVEGSLLLMPGDLRNKWPKKAVHATLNYNYTEQNHNIADVPYVLNQRFYAKKDELVWAKNERDKARGPVVCWSLAGSSLHKVSPFFDTIAARLMIETNAYVVFLGDDKCKILEGGSWDNEPRVWCRSGDWGLRKAMAFTRFADVVVGSETGLMNAIALENVEKIVLLSHSSVTNLTRDWVNTTSLEPTKTHCYPCHKLNLGSNDCPKTDVMLAGEAVKTTLCKAELNADIIYTAVIDALGRGNGNFKRNNANVHARPDNQLGAAQNRDIQPVRIARG